MFVVHARVVARRGTGGRVPDAPGAGNGDVHERELTPEGVSTSHDALSAHLLAQNLRGGGGVGRVGVSGGERLSGFARGRDGAAKRASRGRASGSRTSSGSPLYAAGSGSASAANGASLPRARRARSASSSAPRRASRRGESARRPPPSPRTRPSRRDARATTRATTRGSATRAANVAARPIAIHLAGSRARDSNRVPATRPLYETCFVKRWFRWNRLHDARAVVTRQTPRAAARETPGTRAPPHQTRIPAACVPSASPRPCPRTSPFAAERTPTPKAAPRRRPVAAKAPAPRRRTVATKAPAQPRASRAPAACADDTAERAAAAAARRCGRGRVSPRSRRSSPSPARRIPSSRLRVAFARRRPPLPSREIASATARVSTRRPSSASRARLRDLAPAWVRTTGT